MRDGERKKKKRIHPSLHVYERERACVRARVCFGGLVLDPPSLMECVREKKKVLTRSSDQTAEAGRAPFLLSVSRGKSVVDHEDRAL